MALLYRYLFHAKGVTGEIFDIMYRPEKEQSVCGPLELKRNFGLFRCDFCGFLTLDTQEFWYHSEACFI